MEERRAHPDSPAHTRPRDEATEYIECYILEKNLPPHAKLPSERDMCSMWGFNRTTLRSAISTLKENMGGGEKSEGGAGK